MKGRRSGLGERLRRKGRGSVSKKKTAYLAMGGIGAATVSLGIWLALKKGVGGPPAPPPPPPPPPTQSVSVQLQNRGTAPAWFADTTRARMTQDISTAGWAAISLQTGTDYLLEGTFFGGNPAVVDLTTAGVPAYGIPGNPTPVDIVVDGQNAGDGAPAGSLTVQDTAGTAANWNPATGEGTMATIRFVPR